MADTPAALDRPGIQPYFVAWALAERGREPAEVIADGGFGVDFMAWMSRQWEELGDRLGFPVHDRVFRVGDMLDHLAGVVEGADRG